MHMGSFVQVSDTGWFHTFTEFRNHLAEMMSSEADDALLNVHLDHVLPKSRRVARLRDNFWGQPFGYKKVRTVQEPELKAKMLRKCLFQDHWLSKGHCIPGVGSKR